MLLIPHRETPVGRRVVETLIWEVFWNVYKPDCGKYYYLHPLRQSPVFHPELTFVCETDDVLVGQTICTSSLIKLEADGYLDTVTLGPLVVLPPFRGEGLARTLMCHALRQARALEEQAMAIPGDPQYYGRYGLQYGERWGISLEDGQYLSGPQAMELAPGSLANATGCFHEGSTYALDATALDALDVPFLVREKAITSFQQEFQVICSLGYEVIPSGLMQ